MVPHPEDNRVPSSLLDCPSGERDIPCNETPQEANESDARTCEIVWSNVVAIGVLHCSAFYGIYLGFTNAKLLTLVFGSFVAYLTGFGITGGAHRLWTHRSYKAKWPLKLLLVMCQTIAHQNSVIEWSRDHRVHHKFQETDADPHNVKRGFFFAHCGWLMCKKHPEVKSKGKGIDLSDLYSEPLLRFQHKYFLILMPILCFIVPTVIPMRLWNETIVNSFSINILRYVISLNSTWFVNSIAHMWGSRPFDKHINAAENSFVSLVTWGEGWHNYHHSFTWDYKAAELGGYNHTLTLINIFAKIGWAYDLKTVSPEMIKAKVLRSGDGSHEIWGWGDKDQTPQDYQSAVIYNKIND